MNRIYKKERWTHVVYVQRILPLLCPNSKSTEKRGIEIVTNIDKCHSRGEMVHLFLFFREGQYIRYVIFDYKKFIITYCPVLWQFFSQVETKVEQLDQAWANLNTKCDERQSNYEAKLDTFLLQRDLEGAESWLNDRDPILQDQSFLVSILSLSHFYFTFADSPSYLFFSPLF